MFYRLIGHDSIINKKRFQAPKSIYKLIDDKSTIIQKIFQTPESKRSDKNPTSKF
jgi:hypothetical protein